MLLGLLDLVSVQNGLLESQLIGRLLGHLDTLYIALGTCWMGMEVSGAS